MKFLTLILATTILFLAIKPGIDLISLQSNTEQTCCGGQCKPIADNEKSSDQQKQKDDGSDKPCNPFQLCSCSMCVLQCQTVSSVSFSSPEFLDLHHSYQSSLHSQFASDFWQPPKIV